MGELWYTGRESMDGKGDAAVVFWIMTAVVGWLAAAAALAGLFLLKRNVREAGNALRKLREADTDQRLRLESPDRDAELLLVEINGLLADKQAGNIAHEQRERELRQEIANISHDLRTPLTSVRGYLQLLRDGRCTEEEREEYLSIIENRTQALQMLITGFYDLSRLEAGGYTFVMEPVRLDQVLTELAAAFYSDFLTAGMEPSLELEEKLPPVVADRPAVVRIYTNLLQNALRHGRGLLRISARREGEEVVTRFSNTASGLLPGDVEHLFDRFFTADKMRTGHNTGLGLAIVRGLSGQMGAQTQAGLRGTELTITVRWPLKKNG